MKRAFQFLAGLLTGLAAAGLTLLLTQEPRGIPIELHPPPTPRPLLIHVDGAVENPGVYELPPRAVVQHAIEAAGGISAAAAAEGLNLAAALEDGEQVFVPFRPTPRPSGSDDAAESSAGSTQADGRLNLNAATAPELERLPGIGPALAEAIVAHREAHGPFSAIEDLLDVSGIGPAKLEQIRALVTAP